MELFWINGLVKVLLICILITVTFIVTRRDILSLMTSYRIQSLFLAFLAMVLYFQEQTMTLLFVALLTLVSKVFIIPWMFKKVQATMKIHRDVEFHYLTPVSSMLVSMFIILGVYSAFYQLQGLIGDELFFLGAILGISLTFMGLVIVFSRKKAITKIIGYLTMENGVVLFSLFVTELPFIIEILVILDLIMLVLLVTLLAFGLDASVEEFHYKLHHWFRREEKP
ncbi:hydrogenase subunit [Candidatus Woesearchaeota archaeon]|nr:hydrogenase subunit [Candidatus Woesearchaeota archaeon]